MRRLLRLAANDVRLTLRDRVAFFWIALLPILLMWLFGSMFGGGNTPRVSLTIIDRDLFTAQPAEILKAKVTETIVDGETVYSQK